MTKVRVGGFSLSADGFGAGPAQSTDHPLGERGRELHRWLAATRTVNAMVGSAGGSTGIDDGYAARMLSGCGAFILGRNMFGPVRGEWKDESWKGWWGDNPPFHRPAFILTHFARDPVVMAGGTIFHFVTDGIEAALERAKAAAGELDVGIGGGVRTVRQYLDAGLVDELHLAITPVVLGRGERMFDGLDLPGLGFRVAEHAATDFALHIVLRKEE
jgi:dihydrofolate reductase